MSERQLPFGQLPLLQIDGLELVQSQVIVRYLAKRGNMAGLNSADEIKCDMIAETIRGKTVLLKMIYCLIFKSC
jgi:glutathione S-transferase